MFFPKNKVQFSGTLFPVNFFNISTLHKGGGARPSAPRRGAPLRPEGAHPEGAYPQKTRVYNKNAKKNKKNVHFSFVFWLFSKFRPGPGGSILIQSLVFLSRFTVKKKFFLEAVNQLNKTSDCIKIDSPGPGQSFEKNQKSRKNDPKVIPRWPQNDPKMTSKWLQSDPNMIPTWP